MNHESECDDYQNDNVDGLCICDRLRDAYQRGREDAANAVWEKVLEHNTAITGRIWETSPDQDDYMAAARGAQSHQTDTDQHPDSQRFRYGFGNSIPTAGNTILDDSDDEKVVAGNYVDNVTDAGDTPQPATNWVRSLLQAGDVDTPDGESSEPINGVVRTVSPASTLQNRQAADADV